MIAHLAYPRTLLARIHRDKTGATIVEFAFVAPVLIMLILGIFDMSHTQYTQSMLIGAMQRASRDMTLENAGSRQVAVDDRVRGLVASVVPPGADISFEKLSHFDFSDVDAPEEILTGNGDAFCDSGETYQETNDVAGWQANSGKNGIGGARDAVLYTAVVTYPRMFPVHVFTGMPSTVTLEASSVLRNQPFDEQDRSFETGTC